MEGVTLMESGTSRSHFAFLKRVEAAKSPAQADQIVLSTILDVQHALLSKGAHSFSATSLTSHLLLLLHCLDLFPISNDIRLIRPSIQFALIPALQLAATADKSKGMLIAYEVLGRVFQAQSEDEQRQSSLLLLNTIRQHLERATESITSKGKGKQREERLDAAIDSNILAKASFALRSVISGVPSGPDIFPALYSPISQLCHHTDERIQRLALDALGTIQSYPDFDESVAKAIWNRAKGIFRANQTGLSSKEDGCSLARALLRAAKRAVSQGILNGEAASEMALSLINDYTSPASSIACLGFCVELATDGRVGQVLVDRVRKSIAELCILHSSSYSVLLSSFKLLGRLVNSDTVSPSEEVKAVWALMTAHLGAKNANRKLFVLSALESFLPFAWFEAGNTAEIELEESKMSSLMAMLSDKDETIRLRVLHLFQRIEPRLLDSHMQQMKTASKDLSSPEHERRELSHRALEVAYVRFEKGEAEQYSNTVEELLASSSDDGIIDDGVIRLVLWQLRQADASYSQKAFLHLLEGNPGSEGRPSSTAALLCASLACELECSSQNCQIALTRLTSMVSSFTGQAAVVEAFLIAMIKLASSVQVQESDKAIIATLEKASESSTTSLVQHRFTQLKEVLNNSSGSIRSTSMPSGSLLDTMDRLDSYLIDRRKISTSEKSVTGLTHQSKPLKYDAYSEGTTSSVSQSISSKKAFEALPEPSTIQGSRIRRQRKRQEDEIRNEMQKSIARLTLDTDNSDDENHQEEVDEKREGESKDGILI